MENLGEDNDCWLMDDADAHASAAAADYSTDNASLVRNTSYIVFSMRCTLQTKCYTNPMGQLPASLPF